MKCLVLIASLSLPVQATAAEFFVCERPDGTTVVTDRKAAVPSDCTSVRSVEVDTPAAPQTTPGAVADRSAEYEAAVDRARALRAAREAKRRAFEGEAKAAQLALVNVQVYLSTARDRLHHLRFRWSALFPGDWIPWFADADEMERIERRIAYLEKEEERLKQSIDALRREGLKAGVSRRQIAALLPDVS